MMVILELVALKTNQQGVANSGDWHASDFLPVHVPDFLSLTIKRYRPAEEEQGSAPSDSKEGYLDSPQDRFLQKELNIQTVGNFKCENNNQNSSSLVKLTEKYYKPDNCEQQSVVIVSIVCFVSLFMTVPHSMLKTLTLRHLLSLIVMFIRFLYMGCCCMATDSLSKKHLLVSLLLLANIVGHSEGGDVIETNQRLPAACLSLIHKYDCPIREELGSQDKTWENQSIACCSSYPGTVLICQRNGTTNFPACLPDERVQAGIITVLVIDEKDNPKLVSESCDDTTFEGQERNLSYITYPYCLQTKSKCMGEGKALLCRGGTVGNDFCICATGYVTKGGTDCENGFTDDDDCWCEKMTCLPDQTPVGSQSKPENYSCADMIREGFVVKARCETLPPVTSPPTLDTTGPATRGSSLSLATPMSTFPTNKTANSDPNSGTEYTVIAILVLLCIILAIVLVLCLKSKIRRFLKNKAPTSLPPGWRALFNCHKNKTPTSAPPDPNCHSQQPLVVA